MNEIKVYGSYGEYKSELDTELQKSAEGFVKIGFLLKQARDTDILEESGYKSYIEFAQAEYGIDKTTVSRFIRINDKFSEEGNSEYLQEQYKGYGYAKLAIMLQLPDEVNNILTPEFSKSEIQSIKEEVDEESKITDLEVMMESEPNMTKYCDTSLYKAIMKLCHDEPQIYLLLHKALEDNLNQEDRLKAIAETIAPTETKVCMVRIPGIGRLAVSFKGIDQSIELVNIRSGEKEEHSWIEMLQTILPLILDEDAKDSWSKLFLESFPEQEAPKKEEVAPVQQKPEPKKESKVTKAKVEGKEKLSANSGKIVAPSSQNEKPVENDIQKTLHDLDQNIPEPNPAEESSESNEETVQAYCDEQIPGQDTLDMHPEYMPEDHSSIIDAEYREVVEEKDNTEELQEEALELADIMIAGCLRDWENQKIPIEDIKKCIENAEKLLSVLKKLEAADEK